GDRAEVWVRRQSRRLSPPPVKKKPPGARVTPGARWRLPLAALGPALGAVALGARSVTLRALAARAVALAALRAAATTTHRYGPRRDAFLELLELEIQVLHTSLPLE